MFSIFDKATETYNRPFFMLTEAEATRAMCNLVTDQTTDIAKNPEDYVLCYLGKYDNRTGRLEQDVTHPEHLATAMGYRQAMLEDTTKQMALEAVK